MTIQKQSKRIVQVMLTVALILSVAACESDNSSPSTPSQTQLSTVQEGCLTYGTYQSLYMMDVSPDGTASGVMGIINTEVAKRLDLKACPQLYEFAALIPALQAGRVDMLDGHMSLSQSRSQIFYFAPPIAFFPENLTIKTSATPIMTYDEAAALGYTLGAPQGYWELGLWEQKGIKFKAFDNASACLLDVVGGGIFGCAGVLLEASGLKKQDPATYGDLVVTAISSSDTPQDLNGHAISKNNPKLALAVSQTLTDMWRDGSIQKAWETIFGAGNYEVYTTPVTAPIYVEGPWEDGATPDAPTTYPSVTTITAGVLTVGVQEGTALATVSGDAISGPEGTIVNYVAEKLGLSVKAVSVSDPAEAVRSGEVDVIVGGVPATQETARQFWQSTPTAFSPDYIYVKAADDGAMPAWTTWEDAAAAGKLAVVSGSSRIADLTAAGVGYTEYPNNAAALKAVASGEVAGFVGSTVDYLTTVSADESLSTAGIGFVRNTNLYTTGTTFAWGVKAGNGGLLDALNQGINAAWQQKVIANAYQSTFTGANATSILAPGPTAIGTSYSASKDFTFQGMWVPGPWAQVPGYVK